MVLSNLQLVYRSLNDNWNKCKTGSWQEAERCYSISSIHKWAAHFTSIFSSFYNAIILDSNSYRVDAIPPKIDREALFWYKNLGDFLG